MSPSPARSVSDLRCNTTHIPVGAACVCRKGCAKREGARWSPCPGCAAAKAGARRGDPKGRRPGRRGPLLAKPHISPSIGRWARNQSPSRCMKDAAGWRSSVTSPDVQVTRPSPSIASLQALCSWKSRSIASSTRSANGPLREREGFSGDSSTSSTSLLSCGRHALSGRRRSRHRPDRHRLLSTGSADQGGNRFQSLLSLEHPVLPAIGVSVCVPRRRDCRRSPLAGS